MERRTVTRTLRALRRRRRWSQRRLGALIGVSQAEVSRRERSGLESCTVTDVEEWSSALGAHLVLDLRVDGQRPLTDARHAELQVWLVALLRSAGWIAEAEVSFNHYGDRGRVDVLAFCPRLRVLLVVEIKTQFTDVQDILGRLDIKRRLGPTLASQRGWAANMTVPALVFREESTTRRRLADHAPLFAHLPSRGRSAVAWLRHPRAPAPVGILLCTRAVR